MGTAMRTAVLPQPVGQQGVVVVPASVFPLPQAGVGGKQDRGNGKGGVAGEPPIAGIPESRDEPGILAIPLDERSRALESNAAFFEQWLLNEQLSEYSGDAPTCPSCGQFTIRSGSCYRCLYCGESLGCS